ncbi:hypothetical protein MTBBW1_2130092 [Desulfamplus magnetovallimortis]|uniref:Bacterial type II secretion system protein E domain-containing protein n=1 Tax=Desulfamplus magnetovallimortis TaxID=1246637 RepID=A0A1W1HCI6_9BACT|nr:ATPase, T2SS/T4P/T4SS family [Desulfamplus magnetovallimortis]SLM30197.1 hypothetical protein MTBBW1_2130092 [Desulfamplus magnetovallimortis]
MKKDTPVIDQTLFDLKLNEASFYSTQGLYEEADKIYLALIQELQTLPESKNTNVQIEQLEAIRKEYQSEIKRPHRVVKSSPSSDKTQKKYQNFSEPVAFRNESAMVKDLSVIMDEIPVAGILDGQSLNGFGLDGECLQHIDNHVLLFIQKMILEAHSQKATDIHIEPSIASGKTTIRFRVQGSCYQYVKIPDIFCRTVVSSLKAMARLDMTSVCCILEGKIRLKVVNAQPVILRVIIIPTSDFKEDVVLRFVQDGEAIKVSDMGLLDHNRELLLDMIQKTYGLILVAGRAGSGKSKTLHALLNELNSPKKKIWSVENPVEIFHKGIRQCEVSSDNGLETERFLRSFLRADPDIIMVGGVRNSETSNLIVEASLSGYLVLAALQANSVATAIRRLLEMSGNPANVAHSLRGVLVQRLVKKLCEHCKRPVKSSSAIEIVKKLRAEFGEDPLDLMPSISESKDFPDVIYEPAGCSECGQTGYQGWIGIHEIMVVDDLVKQKVRENPSVDILEQLTTNSNMYSIKQDGILKLFSGLVDLSEMQRVCIQ